MYKGWSAEITIHNKRSV